MFALPARMSLNGRRRRKMGARFEDFLVRVSKPIAILLGVIFGLLLLDGLTGLFVRHFWNP